MAGFIFSSPFFLWMLPLAALPLVFHFFFRVRKRPIPFPTLMFFMKAAPKMHARRKIREWLALLLRILCILFFLLAFSRPIWIAGGKGGSHCVVLVIDNSGSMSVVGENGNTLLQHAIDAANAVLSSLEEKDTAALVLAVQDPTLSIPEGPTKDKTLLKNMIYRIRATEASCMPGIALNKAFDLLRSSGAAAFEIHLFSDLQKAEWEKSTMIELPREGTRCVIHRIPFVEQKGPNVFFNKKRLPYKKTIVKSPSTIEIGIANRTPHYAKGKLHTLDDIGLKESHSFTLSGHEEQSFRFTLSLQTSGFHWLKAWIEGDDFQADNKIALGFWGYEHETALFIGERREYGLLPLALDPSGEGNLSGVVPRFVSPERWEEAMAEKCPVLVVASFPAIARIVLEKKDGRLKSFLEKGGNLLLLPAVVPSADIPAWPSWLGLFPEGAQGSVPEGAKGSVPLALLPFSKNEPFWDEIKNEKNEFLLPELKVTRFYPLRGVENTSHLMGLEDGRGLLSQQRVGEGRAFISGFAFNSSWSSLPLKGAFLPMAQNIALSGYSRSGNFFSLTAGSRIRMGGKEGHKVHLSTVSGGSLDWKGMIENMPVFPYSGIYLLQDGDRQSVYVTVDSSAEEGEWSHVSGSSVAALGNVSHTVWPYKEPVSLREKCKTLRKGIDLYPMLLLGAILLILAEGWVTNPGALAGSSASRRPK